MDFINPGGRVYTWCYLKDEDIICALRGKGTILLAKVFRKAALNG